MEQRNIERRYAMHAPEVERYMRMFGKYWEVMDVTDSTANKVDELFETLDVIEPDGDVKYREIWIRANRGPIDEFGNYKRMKEEGEVKNRKDFKKYWKECYPGEDVWFHLHTQDSGEYRIVAMNYAGIMVFGPSRRKGWYDMTRYFDWMIGAVKDSARLVRDGTYVSTLETQVDFHDRHGIVSRSDYWRAFPNEREDFIEDLTQDDIDEFSRVVAKLRENADESPVGRLRGMTVNDYYGFCSEAYKACGYSDLEGLSLREKYEANADGRDDGLGEINPDSQDAFREWFLSCGHGAHPWEIGRYGTALFVHHDDDGFSLEVYGSAPGCSVEATKMFLALARKGLPVGIRDGSKMVARYHGKDMIGIVPRGILPVHCEHWFSDVDVLDCINLPMEESECKTLLPYVKWRAFNSPRLKSK